MVFCNYDQLLIHVEIMTYDYNPLLLTFCDSCQDNLGINYKVY